MAIRTVREPRGGVVDWLFRPLEWLSAFNARLSGMMNQERWTFVLTLLAVVLANLVILAFFLQGQDNRAIAFVILALIAPLAFLIPELSIVVFISAGAGLFVNAFYFAAGPGGGTGERTLTLLFLGVLSARAIYEYFQSPKEQRPKLWTWITGAIMFYWLYHLVHVAFIYISRYNLVPEDSVEAVLGFYRPGIFRYFDYHMLWIGIFPILILLGNYRRAIRTLIMLGIVMLIGLGSVLWEYFAPLPYFFKVLFQLQAAGEGAEGYRIRDPAALYLFMMGFFFALYAIGYVRGWKNVIVVAFIVAAAFAILVTKNRILWGGILLMLPIALLWKPPQILLRQATVGAVAALFFLMGMLVPQFNTIATRIYNETMERWSRNYAYGGDPRLDPSYQAREREREAWEWSMRNRSTSQLLFGSGLESTYGLYISLYDAYAPNPRFRQLYVEKIHMHFAWLKRLTNIGIFGVALLAFVLAVFFIRSAIVFYQVKNPLMRALIVGVVGATVGVLAYDSLHALLHRSEALPVILMWALVELIPHWKRTGQIDQEPQPAETSPV